MNAPIDLESRKKKEQEVVDAELDGAHPRSSSSSDAEEGEAWKLEDPYTRFSRESNRSYSIWSD